MHRKKHMWKMRLVAAGLVAILGISCFQSASASALSKAKNKKSEAQTAKLCCHIIQFSLLIRKFPFQNI